MWKKQEDAMGTPVDFNLQMTPEQPLEVAGEGPVELYGNGQPDKGKSTGPQRVVSEVPQSSKAATMAAYTEAVNEFTRNATAFIEQLPLLTKARDAYDRAMKANAELHKVLDAGEGDLRALMTQLAQVLNDHVVKPGPEKKRPELARLEATRGTEEVAAEAKRFL